MNISNQIQPFQYLGSKYSVLPWLLTLLPDTHSFCDVFGGSGVVILNKKPSAVNTYNDLNQNVVNFMKVLRNKPEQLIQALELTPYSRREYLQCKNISNCGDVERARRYFVRLRQSFLSTGSHENNKGWYTTGLNSRNLTSDAVSKFLGSVGGLLEVVEKLKQIQIEDRCFREVINIYDGPYGEHLFYLDPPYDSEFRSGKNDYTHEFKPSDHEELADMVHNVKGLVAISGYDSQMMNSLYADFQKHIGPVRKNSMSKKEGVRECLWTNYDINQFKTQLTIFDAIESSK